jgi:hypothetical protein
MNSLSENQFWFVVAAVALTPMLTFWIADVIGWFFRRTLWRRPEVKSQPDVSRHLERRSAPQRRKGDAPGRMGY